MKKGYSFLPGWLAGASLLQAAPGDIDPALNLALGGNPASVVSLATLPDIRWMRGGTSPEAEGVTFDLSTDGGGSWLPLGSAVRIPGGWEAAQVDLSPFGRIRARARIAGGMGNTSSSLIETTSSYSFTAAESGASPALAPSRRREMRPTMQTPTMTVWKT